MKRRALGGRIAACSVLLALAASTPAHAAGLPAGWQKGANLTSWDPGDYGTQAADDSLAALRGTGSDSVSVVPAWYMDSARSTRIAPGPRTPDDGALVHAMARAKELGFRLVVKPHVDAAGLAWRSGIAPADVDAWFASYRTFIDHYADMAQRAGADVFVVGTEYSSMTRYGRRWRAVIADVRARFAGKLTFAANWVNGAQAINFWDALDFIGVDVYMPLSGVGADPSVPDIVSAWQRSGYVSQLAELARRWHKPVIFPEVGYYPHTGTVTAPYEVHWEWEVSPEAQRRAYEAFYEVFGHQSWLAGLYWWDWPAVYTYTTDYSPRGLPAEQTMRAWNTAPPPRTLGDERAADPVRRLTLHVRRAGRRPVFRGGRLRSATCSGVVRVSLHRWNRGARRWRRARRTHAAPLAGGRYRLERRLRAGTYRVRIERNCPA